MCQKVLLEFSAVNTTLANANVLHFVLNQIFKNN
jgi:hypothetical protein